MINTGIIYDIKKYAIHDGPGIRTTVFLKGCPLDCWWCHNPESRQTVPESRKNLRPHKSVPLLSQTPEFVGTRVNVEDVMAELRKDVLFYDQSGGGVTFSGGEPMLQPDFLKDLLEICNSEDIHTTVDTSGYVEFDDLKNIVQFTDLFLYDLKLMNDQLHQKYTGVSNRLILENVQKLQELDVDIQIRVPLIPGITDTEINLVEIIDFLKQKTALRNVDVLPFNSMGKSKYERLENDYRLGDMQMQSPEKLEWIKALFQDEGFKVG